MADPSPPPRSKAGDEEGRMEVRLRGEKIYTLAYADDIVLLAEEEDMRAMIARLERYVREKRLEVNVGK